MRAQLFLGNVAAIANLGPQFLFTLLCILSDPGSSRIKLVFHLIVRKMCQLAEHLRCFQDQIGPLAQIAMQAIHFLLRSERSKATYFHGRIPTASCNSCNLIYYPIFLMLGVFLTFLVSGTTEIAGNHRLTVSSLTTSPIFTLWHSQSMEMSRI